MKDFIDFVRTQGVIGLAVGLILGGAVSELVKSLIENLINPVLGLVLGSTTGLKGATFMLGEATISYGAFLATLINFTVVAIVVYVGVKKLKLDKLDKAK